MDVKLTKVHVATYLQILEGVPDYLIRCYIICTQLHAKLGNVHINSQGQVKYFLKLQVQNIVEKLLFL